jgi:hypothetical protein
MAHLLNETFMSETEAGAFLGLAVPTLRARASRRLGPPRVKIGKRVVYRKAALLSWLLKQETDPEAARRAAGRGREERT